MRKQVLIYSFVLLMLGCQNSNNLIQTAQNFIDNYTDGYQDLYYAASQAEWVSNTRIVEGDSTNAIRTREANEALAAFTGNAQNIEKIQQFLRDRGGLSPLQVKQLEYMLYMAANNPQTVPELVKERIKAETLQNEQLFGFDFKIDRQSVSTNEIDDILREETNLDKRLAAWRASKEVGKVLKKGLAELQDLRNRTVQALNYSDYFSYQVSEYGLQTAEMMELNKKLIREIWPLYRELHTFARYELAKKYGVKEVPDMLPAHWLPNRWGQDWNSMVTVEGMDLNRVLKEKDREWLMKQGEQFYISLGFDALPQSFWEKSSLYPLPPDAGYKKNNHASAWHMNLDEDVRCLMSVVPNRDWYETVHHELGHIYYFISYSNPNVPITLREGANRAFHEAIGSLMGLAAMQKPFIAAIDLLPEDIQTDDQQSLLKEALNYIVFIPWASGVMTHFEYELYAEELPVDEFNQKWWDLKKTFQGIVPPESRGEDYCDPASKTHINNDAAQYYDYALSYVLLFQFHEYISDQILQQDPHATNYYGKKGVGRFLKNIMVPGASKNWRSLLEETIGEKMSAKAMLNYFQPLLDYLKTANAGREHTLPESI